MIKQQKLMFVGLFCAIFSLQIVILASFHFGDHFFLRDDYDPNNYFINNEHRFDNPEYQLRRDLVMNRTLGKTFDPQTATVGSIRDQFYYILALLETPHPERQNLTRANLMIRSAFQEYYYRSKSFGFRQWNALRKQPWSEDIDDYDSNYVNFVSPYLAFIGIEHWDKLEPETINVIKKCYPAVMGVFYAIHNRVSYTNMFLLRCAGQLMLGVMYNDITMINMAQYEFSLYVDMISQNGYPEYNSPNYVYIDIWALQCIYSYAPDAEYRWYARGVLEWFYMQYVQSYHPSTGYMAGTSDRMKGGDYWWGRGSHSNIFYQYFGFEKERDEFGSSGTRLLTNYRYYPSDYIGEVAINKTFPLTVEAINYGIESYTYLMENYTLGTRSGAYKPEEGGGTSSDLSGEAMELFITYNTSYPSQDEDYVRKSAWFDTSPHYNVWNSLQVNGTAITTVNFDVEEKRKEDEYSLFGKLGEDSAIREIRINNSIWDGNPVAFNHESVVTIDINGTYMALRPTPSRTMTVSGGVTGLSESRPCVLEFDTDEYNELSWNELNIRNYVYRNSGTELLPDKDIYAGFCIEVSSKGEIGSFSHFSSLANRSYVTSEFDVNTDIHAINYTSKINNVSLYLAENTDTNRLIERKINNTRYELNYLLRSKYSKIPVGATIEDIHDILIYDGFADADSDGLIDKWETTFGLTVGIDDSAADNDSDGLTNIQEYQFHTNPIRNDTDGDGLLDSEALNVEIECSAINANSDGDSITDGKELSQWIDNPMLPGLFILLSSVILWSMFGLIAYKIFKQKLPEINESKRDEGIMAVNRIKESFQSINPRSGLLFGIGLITISHALELFVPALGRQVLLYYSSALFIRMVGFIFVIIFLNGYYKEYLRENISIEHRKGIFGLYIISLIPFALIISLDIAVICMFISQKGWWLYQTFVYWELILSGLLYIILGIIIMRTNHIGKKSPTRKSIVMIEFMLGFSLFASGAGFSIINYLSTTRNDFNFWEFLLPHGITTIILISQILLLSFRKSIRNIIVASYQFLDQT